MASNFYGQVIAKPVKIETLISLHFTIIIIIVESKVTNRDVGFERTCLKSESLTLTSQLMKVTCSLYLPQNTRAGRAFHAAVRIRNVEEILLVFIYARLLHFK